jgi:hypothetical protein
MSRDEELAREALAPLLNPEPHPFQEQFSSAHSMSLPALLEAVTRAIAAAREEGYQHGLSDVAKISGVRK